MFYHRFPVATVISKFLIKEVDEAEGVSGALSVFDTEWLPSVKLLLLI